MADRVLFLQGGLRRLFSPGLIPRLPTRVRACILSCMNDKLKSKVKPVLDDATGQILAQKDEVARLKTVADKHPFYKYNGLWTRELQNLVRSLI